MPLILPLCHQKSRQKHIHSGSQEQPSYTILQANKNTKKN